MGQPGPLLGPTYDHPGKDLWDRGDAAYTLYVSSIQLTRRHPLLEPHGPLIRSKPSNDSYPPASLVLEVLEPLIAVSNAVQAAAQVLDDQRT
jgi:hypothetical protein